MKRLLLILLIPTFCISMNKTKLSLPLAKSVLISLADSLVDGTISVKQQSFSLVFKDYKDPEHVSHSISYIKACQSIQFMIDMHTLTEQKLNEINNASGQSTLRIYSIDSNKIKRHKILQRIEVLQKAKSNETMLMAIAIDRFNYFYARKDLNEKGEDKTIGENRVAFLEAIQFQNNNRFKKIAGRQYVKKPVYTTMGIINKMIEDHQNCKLSNTKSQKNST